MEQQRSTIEDLFIGTWVLVTNGPARFFGRVHKLDLRDLPKSETKEVQVETVLFSKIISFKPTFDFFAPLRPVMMRGADGRPQTDANGNPVMSMARDPLCTGRDFSNRPQVTHLVNGPGITFDFFCQMEDEDRKTYQSFIEAVAKSRYNLEPSAIHTPDSREVAAITRQHGLTEKHGNNG
jgi:hypothetical protein